MSGKTENLTRATKEKGKKDFLELVVELDPIQRKEQDLSKGLCCRQALRGCHPWELGVTQGLSPNHRVTGTQQDWHLFKQSSR